MTARHAGRRPVRARILDATLACIERGGMRGFALEDVAAEADLARATIYRHFPGGREELISETVTREVARFWTDIAAEVARVEGLEGRLVRGLMLAWERLASHQLLQRLVASEPEEFLPALFESEPLVHLVMRDYFGELLAAERLAAGVDRQEAADYLARMLLSHMGSPAGRDLSDEEAVRGLVATEFLGGILAPPR